MEKQRLLYQQSRLHNRGAAEMVLQMISACKGRLVYTVCLEVSCTVNTFMLSLRFVHVGETGPMVTTTLKLGNSILNGGNCEVQRVCILKTVKSFFKFEFFFNNLFLFQKMLEYLRDKKDVGFFLSIQALMQTCRSVLFF